jgi:hypothetical protein
VRKLRYVIVSGSLPDEIAANSNEIVTFVPGTLSAHLAHATDTTLARNATATAAQLNPEPLDIMPPVFPSFDDQTRPWEAISNFVNPGFESALVCLVEQCALVPSSVSSRYTPAMVVR